MASLSCAEIGYCTNCASIKNFEKKFPEMEKVEERGKRVREKEEDG